MASKGYVISVATDSRLFEQGVRMGIIKPVQDADTALTGLGKNKGPDQLTGELKDAQRATEKLGDEARQTAERMQADYRQSAKTARDTNRQSTSDFELSTREKTKLNREAIKEIGSEAKQNAAETFSSFDGSAQSLVDGIQGTFGGLVASLGPIGLAVGAAGALGIGLINGMLQKGDEDAKAYTQAVNDLAGAMIDAGTDGTVPLQHTADTLKKMATGTDDLGHSLKDLNEASAGTATSYTDLANAYAGNTDQLKEAWRASKEAEEAKKAEAAAAERAGGIHDNEAISLSHVADKQHEVTNLIGQSLGVAKAADDAQKLYDQTGAAAAAAKQTQLKNLDQAYDEAAVSVEAYTNQENGLLDTQKYIDAMMKKAAALDGFKDNMQKAALTLSPEATQFLQSQGTDAAAQLVQAYLTATADQRQKLDAVWSVAGKTSAESYSGAIRANLPPTVDGPTVVIRDVDTSRVIGQIQQTLAGHTFRVNAAASVRVGNAVF